MYTPYAGAAGILLPFKNDKSYQFSKNTNKYIISYNNKNMLILVFSF
jgi:hypothetical protein